MLEAAEWFDVAEKVLMIGVRWRNCFGKEKGGELRRGKSAP